MYVEPGKSNSNCLPKDSADALCPPPVSAERKRTFRPFEEEEEEEDMFIYYFIDSMITVDSLRFAFM